MGGRAAPALAARVGTCGDALPGPRPGRAPERDAFAPRCALPARLNAAHLFKHKQTGLFRFRFADCRDEDGCGIRAVTAVGTSKQDALPLAPAASSLSLGHFCHHYTSTPCSSLCHI